jgi:tripartite-type tricarboxylate transporter receptor subunit TctC
VKIWGGLFAPAGTPAPIVERLNKEMNKIVGSPEFGKLLEATAAEPWTGSSAELHDFLASEIARWRVVVRDAGVKAE